jgi:hypothetical protein
MEISVFDEKIQDFPGCCEKKQKYSRESAEKPRIEQITRDKMLSFNFFAFQSSDLPESAEESQTNSEILPSQFVTEN